MLIKHLESRHTIHNHQYNLITIYCTLLYYGVYSKSKSTHTYNTYTHVYICMTWCTQASILKPMARGVHKLKIKRLTTEEGRKGHLGLEIRLEGASKVTLYVCTHVKVTTRPN